MNHPELHPRNYYRMPWTFNDNILAWLEPTKACNLYCEGCYSDNEPQSHKSLDQIRADMQTFVSARNVDSVSIAGGDPLVHPHIVDVVRMVRQEFDKKPIVNTNGVALDQAMLRDLKKAGVFGFTFHVDSSQRRPHWKGRTEVELNELRLHFAEMVAREGGMSCAFNSTVFPHTVDDVPALVGWGADHIDIVHSMVFILYRTLRTRDFQYLAHGKPVDAAERVYHDQDENPEPLVASDVIDRIRQVYPEYDPAAYLGGTKDPNSFKWLIAGRMGKAATGGRSGQTMGYVGRRYMEIMQAGHHLLTGNWLGYVQPSLLSHGRTVMAALSPLDPKVRHMWGRWLKDVARKPMSVRDRVHFQTLLVIQPIDVLADGEMNMCDGCPDITVHDGELVWSCRLDERKAHGVFYTAVPRDPPEAR